MSSISWIEKEKAETWVGWSFVVLGLSAAYALGSVGLEIYEHLAGVEDHDQGILILAGIVASIISFTQYRKNKKIVDDYFGRK